MLERMTELKIERKEKERKREWEKENDAMREKDTQKSSSITLY